MNKKVKQILESQPTPVDPYYHLDRILSKNCLYNMIFGERSSGKTYAALEYCLKQYFEHGKQFAYVRRWSDDIKGKRASTLFDGHAQNGLISDLSKGEYNSIYFYSGRFYLSFFDEQKQKRVNSPEPIGFCFAVNAMEHDKSSSFPNINTIVFDEFLSRQNLVDETTLFFHIVSTIFRKRYQKDRTLRIFMLGNTVNKWSPYFTDMRLKNIKKMQQGQIDVYTYPNPYLTVAVEYTGSGIGATEATDALFAFDSPKLQMITNGDWELDTYPRCPMKYRPDDVRMSYFISFDEEMLQCDIIKIDQCVFTFVHRKTTPLKDEDSDIIFSTEYDPRPNHRRKINAPYDKIGQLIWSQFTTDSVYYQDNEVGDMVMNFISMFQ